MEYKTIVIKSPYGNEVKPVLFMNREEFLYTIPRDTLVVVGNVLMRLSTIGIRTTWCPLPYSYELVADPVPEPLTEEMPSQSALKKLDEIIEYKMNSFFRIGKVLTEKDLEILSDLKFLQLKIRQCNYSSQWQEIKAQKEIKEILGL